MTGEKKFRKTRRWIAVLTALVTLMILPGLTGCGGEEAPKGPAPGTIVAEDTDTLTVVDQAGREVTVKRDPQTIALSYRVVIRFLLSLDQGDKIVGIGKSEPFLEELQPSLADCVDVGKGVADIEALAELKPDLFIHKASDTKTLDAVTKIGIPAIGIDVETPENMMTALDLLGTVCGASAKAEELHKNYDETLKDLEERTADLKEDDRPAAIVMGSTPGKVADGSMLQGEMLRRAGGINCAQDLEATELWPTAGIEQIFQWDPEFIFITRSESATYTAKDILKDPAWAEVRAVKKKQVYDLPAEKDSWEFPGAVSVLGIEYMMHVMHPDLLSEEELEEDAKAFYETSYGRTFTREELGY